MEKPGKHLLNQAITMNTIKNGQADTRCLRFEAQRIRHHFAGAPAKNPITVIQS